MLFNSIDFAVFLPILFILYWFVANRNLKIQNVLIVLASYVFYGWWDWKFLTLILFSTILDYSIGIALSRQEKVLNRKFLLWISVFINLGLLGFFKYYNFFIDNFVSAFSFFGRDLNISSLNIILPVGISFYTFQTMSYTIDVYRRNLKPTNDFVAFSAFVSFFSQLVAGPIERATHLLPQFYVKRTFDYSKAVDGMRQILWGLFKKIVIADNCAIYANNIFNEYENYSGSTLFIGVVFFAFQIYGDFSGYSDIAIGTSKLFGFDLKKNFAFPYFSRDIAEFWRRWHISLSTWFRDYLYIPLGGSRGRIGNKIRNIFLIFIISGFWHGANWTFIIWGALNALYFLPLLLMNNNRNNLGVVSAGRIIPRFRDLISIVITFCLVVFAWIFFRAESVSHALEYINKMITTTLFEIPHFKGMFRANWIILIVILFVLIEWLGRDKDFPIAQVKNQYIRWFIYFFLILLMSIFKTADQNFIYFQF